LKSYLLLQEFGAKKPKYGKIWKQKLKFCAPLISPVQKVQLSITQLQLAPVFNLWCRWFDDYNAIVWWNIISQ